MSRAFSLEESEAIQARNRRAEHACTVCGHRRDQHSYDREDDFMCLICPPGSDFFDPMTKAEWARAFGWSVEAEEPSRNTGGTPT